MGLSGFQLQRLRELASEVREIVGGCMHPDGRPKTFAQLEDECIEAGDLLTAAVLQGRIAERSGAEEAACCPTCHREGERRDDEPRVVQADRGEVSWLEASFYCRHCRRSFFPSDG